MSKFHSLTAIRSYVGAQMKGKEAGAAPDAPDPRPFITISRQAGAGGTTVAEHLAEILNRHHQDGQDVPWTVFDRELVERVLAEHGLPKAYVAYLREEATPTLETLFAEMSGLKTSRKGLAAKTARTILNLAGLGKAIIVGRAGAVVTRRLPGGVHARLIGSPEARLKRVMRYYKLDQDVAKETMKTKDSGRRAYVRKYFGEDVGDPLLYDLTINTDRVPYGEAARLIAAALAPKTD